MTKPEACPKCGDVRCAVASDGRGDVAAVAAVCVGCGYVTTWVVDLSTDLEEAHHG